MTSKSNKTLVCRSFLTLFALSAPNFAIATAAETDLTASMKQLLSNQLFASGMEWIQTISPNMHRGVLDNFEAIGISQYKRAGGSTSRLAESNQGLTAHFTALFKTNDKFADQARAFYDEVRILDLQFRVVRGDYSKPSGGGRFYFTSPRVKLTEETGQGQYAAFAPGWLWQAAMKSSKSKPNLAMTLIALCGHDDYQEFFDWAEIDFNNKNKFANREAHRIADLEALLLKQNPSKNLLDLFRDRARQGLGQKLCPPPDSPFYAPKALRAETDIANYVKDDIARAQAPALGRSALPAKAYHVLAGMYAGQFLSRRGLPWLAAREVIWREANSYRASSLCEQKSSAELLRSVIAKNFGAQALQEDSVYEALFVSLQNQPKDEIESACPDYNNIVRAKSGMFALRGDAKDLNCSVRALARINDPFQTYSSEQIRARIPGLLASVDAFEALGRSRFNENGCVGLQFTADMWDFTKRYGVLAGPDNPCKLANLPSRSQRCANLRAKLNTWRADFEWTVRSHILGARFAHDHAARVDGDQDPFNLQ